MLKKSLEDTDGVAAHEAKICAIVCTKPASQQLRTEKD
jgi:hypothetical protein